MKNIENAVRKHEKLILDAERYIWKNPETGYREKKTGTYLEEQFEMLGYKLNKAGNIPGFTATVDTGREGPTVLILGELDSIICPTHPEADPETGAVHSCGHNAQCATLLGIAAAIREDGVLDTLSGRIMLAAVPAEELLEIGYRSELRASGVIKYFGGKSEFLHRGMFDGVDLALMVHTASSYCVRDGSVGCITKRVLYKGKAAHAGGSPWNGRNALYAANCGLNAVNAIRETFEEKDLIRVHPIITHGGDMVNAIPETVELESYIRGASFDAIYRANKKVDRALIGAAVSLGVNIEIIDNPGYSPLVNSSDLIELVKEAAAIAMPDEKFDHHTCYSTGSTDMGDLSAIMPAVHPYAAGAVGTSHGNDYYVSDPERACVKNAIWQITMLTLLLQNGAERAKSVIEGFTPAFTKEEFLAYQDSLARCGDRIRYTDGEATLIF